MMLLTPIWLVLAIPLGLSLWLWRMPTRFLAVIRALVMILLVLAACSPAIRLPSRTGTVVVVADRSLSMPTDAEARQLEAVKLIQSQMGPEDKLAVVSFGASAAVDQPPQHGEFAGFVSRIGQDASNLADALETAVSLIPERLPGRILLLTDGRFTGPDPADRASRAATRSVPIDWRLMERPTANDLAIARIDAPAAAKPGESFLITMWIRSPIRSDVSFEILRNGQRISSGSSVTSPGLTRLTFRDQAEEPGTFVYEMKVSSSQADPVVENNSAKLLVGIEGALPVLCVSGNRQSNLPGLLAAGGLDVVSVPDEQLAWTLEDLSRYAAVVLENLPADRMNAAAMANLAGWISGGAGGLMMTGGRNSYGPGGYYRSALEHILPVSMELRREHRKFSLAIVVALDRSGSMAAPVGSGKTKMDLANAAAAEVYNLLSSMDEFGCVAVDSSPHVIAPLARVDKTSGVRGKLLRIDSMGGGIFVYEALSTAAAMLAKATAGTKHIILFADAADSEQPGKYAELLAKCAKAGVTCSVIGLGSAGDCDAPLLRDIAKRGSGRCFFTNSPTELPRLFAQDTFAVARNAFLDQLTQFKMTGFMTSLAGTQFPSPLPLGGYNLCYLRPRANLAAMTLDEHKAPVIAAWQAGLGRVLCYTGEVDGKFTGPIARWDRIGDFLCSQARWAAGENPSLPQEMLITHELRDGCCWIRLHLDPDREHLPFEMMPSVQSLRGLPGEPPSSSETPMQWSSADEMSLQVPLSGRETLLSTVCVPGVGSVRLPPVCLPYSPEYQTPDSFGGPAALDQLAKLTGGKRRLELGQIWNDLPRKPQIMGVARWLFLAAAVLVLVEALERRTGLLTAIRLPRLQLAARVGRTTGKIVRSRRKKSATAAKAGSTAEPPVTDERTPKAVDEATQEAHDAQPDMLDALGQALRRANGRTRR